MAIGRNEGVRLERCLTSLRKQSEHIVYVDSGSKDASVNFARGQGAVIIELDEDQPFTAARARNAGFDALLKEWPDLEYVMFIDGDCELAEGFPVGAINSFQGAAEVGVVTGRCRELFPDATIYNRLCEMEWDGPIGEIDACGGIFMTRMDVFKSVNGFNPDIIAAEDDDFCVRVRGAGFKIHRIDCDLCFHDADMHHFSQWWQRSLRAGHAYAQVGEIHPGYFSSPRRRAWLWGLILPIVALLGIPFTGGWSLVLLGLYPLSYLRTRANLIKNGAASSHASLHAWFLTLSKFPNLIGMLDYRRKRLQKRSVTIVEYK